METAGTLERLVRIDSTNASLGGPGEQAVGEAVAELLADLGGEVSVQPVDGEPAGNVIGRFASSPDAPVILLEAHLDTVPQPSGLIPVTVSGGRLSGRGTADTKGSAVSMIAAIERLLAEGCPATLVFAGVVDEEAAMHGAGALQQQIGRIDAAVIGEPTSMMPVRAHNGFARIRITAQGVAAHTSKAYLGKNALTAAARVAIALEDQLLPRLQQRGHDLIGPALVTPSVFRAGHTPNIVPDFAELVIDRRIAPGEELDDVLAELDEVLEGVRAQGHDITRHEPYVILPGVETPDDHPLVAAAIQASRDVLGRDVAATGAPYSTDACRLAVQHPIPAIVLGPGSIDQAHTANEWIDLSEVDRCVDVFVGTVNNIARGFVETGTS